MSHVEMEYSSTYYVREGKYQSQEFKQFRDTNLSPVNFHNLFSNVQNVIDLLFR